MHEWDRPAPGELWRVQRLINTFDVDDGSDVLSVEWLVEHGLASPGEAVDLDHVRAVREALRKLLLTGEPDPVLSGPVTVTFLPDGAPRVTAADVVGRVLAICAAAAADGTWERLKSCPADDCHWAFYDFSRNRSRTWCTMSVCGNRAKARTYRSKASA